MVDSNEDFVDMIIIQVWETYSHSPIPSLVLSKQGKIVHYNNAMKKLTGYAHREVPDIEAWMPKLYPDEKYRNYVIEVSRKSRQREIDEAQEEFVITRKNGEKRFIEFYMFDIIKDGKPTDFQIVQGINRTERKRAEEQIRYHVNLLNNVKDAIITSDENYILTSWNAAAETLYGWKAEEVLGRYGLDITKTEFPGVDKKEMLMTIEKAGLWRGEVTQARKDGTRFFAEVNSIVLYDESGKNTGYVSVNRDITERKRVEELLHESGERYRNLFDTAPDSIFVVNRNSGNFLASNPAASKLYGYTKEEFLRMIASDVSAEPEKTVAVIRDGITHVTSRLHRKKDGTIFPVEISGSFFLQGGRDLHTAFIRDITERKMTEKTIRDSEERYRSLYEQIPDLYISLNPTGEIIECNLLGARKLGYSVDELIGRQMKSLLTEESIWRFDKEFPILMASGIIRNVERSIIAKSGQVHDLVLNAEVDYDPDGKPLRTRAIFHDITEIKRAEAQLREDKEMLRLLALELTAAEDRERKQLAEYLHDMISQALVVIKMKLGILQNLKDTKDIIALNKEINELLEQAIESTRSVTFDLSSPVLDKLGFEPAAEWLCEKITNDHGLAVDFSCESRAITLDDDMKRFLYRSVRELLMNVVKHANAQSAKVSVRRKKGMVCITVDDDGVGFREALEDNRYLELGFGLFSIRERLDFLGGSMEIDSKPGCGASVSLYVSLERKERSKKQE